jgi:hypothetical protein
MEDFDVYDIDPSTIMLEGVMPLRWSYDDVATPWMQTDCDCTTEGGDGYTDLTLKFDRTDIIEALGAVYAGDEIVLEITGYLNDGTAFSGTDCIRIVGGPEGSSSLRSSNHPNPFNAGTTITYGIDAPGHVNLTVYNILGQNVATLVDGFMPAGDHAVEWDGRNSNGESVSSGMYFYRVTAGGESVSRKMLLLK